MRGTTLLVLSLIGCPQASSGQAESPSQMLSAAEKAAGWRLLFDGATLDGWRSYRGDSPPARGWAAEGGTLHCTSGGGDIITRDQFGEFELSFEWKVAPGANSGVIYLCTEEHGACWQTGPEYQVLDDAAQGSGLDPLHSAGAMYALYSPAPDKPVKPAGEWNTGRIVVRGDVIQHWLNGEKIVEGRRGSEDYRERIAGSKFSAYTGFGVQKKGHIALQDHGDEVWYRNIKVRDLDKPMPGEIALFNGRDLSGWQAFLRDSGTLDGTFSVRDGVIVCSGQPYGYMYTEREFEDFVLHLEWRWSPETKATGNSGVLFHLASEHRVWPRSFEAQLHAGSAGDIIGIGGFPYAADDSRRDGARTAHTRNAENPPGEWNHYEIISDGGRVTLWVNGYKVNEAWNVEAHAGPICLQSEGTEIQFRGVRIAPIR